jgi:uncharacterized protein YjbI with pentapeptide repeats
MVLIFALDNLTINFSNLYNVTTINMPNFILNNINFVGIDLSNAILTNANLTNSILSLTNLNSTNLSYANLTNANLIGANLTGANLTYADLTGADLTGANLTNANLTGITLTDTTILTTTTLNGVISGNITGITTNLPTNWSLINCYLIGPDTNLTNANLTNADLSGADLSIANLTDANLTGANLSKANLINVTIYNTIFNKFTYYPIPNPIIEDDDDDIINIIVINKSIIDLGPPTLPDGYIIVKNSSEENYIVGPNVNLTNANLTGANLTNANLTGVILPDGYTYIKTIITLSPSVETFGYGSISTFTITSTLNNVSYQLYKSNTNNINGTAISGATLSSYTTPTTLYVGTHYYYYKIINTTDIIGTTTFTNSFIYTNISTIIIEKINQLPFTFSNSPLSGIVGTGISLTTNGGSGNGIITYNISPIIFHLILIQLLMMN